MAPSNELKELALLFLKLGFTAFGGPAAHIAMMRDETVERRKWLDDGRFLDLIGATNLIPGPNSTEMAIHIGYLRAGVPGLVVAGVCFIVPAMSIVSALAWAYARYGGTPEATWLLYGIKPVVIAIVAHALWILGRKALAGPLTAFVGIAALALYFFRVNEIALLIAGGLVVMAARNVGDVRGKTVAIVAAPLTAAGHAAGGAAQFGLSSLFLTFLKIGSVLYGSGYVLLAFLRNDFVVRSGLLTDQQLIDAIAIGQMTPGPVFTTATFIGYILGGMPAALVATLGIFLPSFIFVALSNPLIPKIRNSKWAGAVLDGVNVASLGLMAAVTIQLGRASLTDPLTIGVSLVSLALLVRYKINTTWLIFGGALIGALSAFASGNL